MAIQSLSSSKSRKYPLTFGIELEMAIATRSPYHPDQFPDDPRSIDLFDPNNKHRYRMEDHIIKTLRSMRISAERQPTYGLPKDRNSWVVKRDSTIMVAPYNGLHFEYHDIEIVSPIYYCTLAALKEVQTVCEVLTATYRVQTNTSTGLHVHIGDGDKGFRLGTIRNLMALLWTFDVQIIALHPPSRMQDNVFCAGFRSYRSILARDVTVGYGINERVDAKQGLEHLLGASDASFLLEMCKSSIHKMAYHLGDVFALDSGSTRKRTIEFRQHKGTLNFELICNWILFTEGVVSYADTVDQEGLFAWLRECVNKTPEQYPLQNMLNRMGLYYLAGRLPEQITRQEKEEELEGTVGCWEGMSRFEP